MQYGKAPAQRYSDLVKRMKSRITDDSNTDGTSGRVGSSNGNNVSVPENNLPSNSGSRPWMRRPGSRTSFPGKGTPQRNPSGGVNIPEKGMPSGKPSSPSGRFGIPENSNPSGRVSIPENDSNGNPLTDVEARRKAAMRRKLKQPPKTMHAS